MRLLFKAVSEMGFLKILGSHEHYSEGRRKFLI